MDTYSAAKINRAVAKAEFISSLASQLAVIAVAHCDKTSHEFEDVCKLYNLVMQATGQERKKPRELKAIR